ncbi:putative necrosis-inducing factor-domain-containing protein [Massariosphaeria phaeospora]|uniref:Putative necrosis-inducing factor-domain-containing protein n=1 Tax=Massariosphaeria phaeospora TaxID=100035 RepID=A0A7C8MAG2_9PLEO|nr:putative necrosis-inducing factor-domain-containing protein [Massariosphaeria phaeospora]
MRFTAGFIPLFLAATVSSAPAGWDQKCLQGATFSQETTDKSPLVEDCRQVIRNIEGGGVWLSDFWRDLAKHGSCAFGVDEDKSAEGMAYQVGNRDIIGIMDHAIQQFEKNGHVGASGIVYCHNQWDGHTRLKWAIHTPL